MCRRLVVAVAASGVLFAPELGAETATPPVTEAEVHMIWGEHLGSAPMVLAGASMELGPHRAVGLMVGALVAVASPHSLTFMRETAAGGGLNTAVRLYLGGDWPSAFGVGAAASLVVVEGVAVASPRLELFYRFVVLDHLALRPHAAVGGLLLWDTAPDDERLGPADRGESYTSNSVKGFWFAFGLAVGYAP